MLIFLLSGLVGLVGRGMLNYLSRAGEEKARQARREATKRALGVLVVGVLLFTLVGMLPALEERALSSLLGFDLFDLIGLFWLFGFYKITSAVLETIASELMVSRVWLGMSYLALITAFLLGVRSVLGAALFSTVILNIPAIKLWLANVLVIVLYISSTGHRSLGGATGSDSRLV